MTPITPRPVGIILSTGIVHKFKEDPIRFVLVREPDQTVVYYHEWFYSTSWVVQGGCLATKSAAIYILNQFDKSHKLSKELCYTKQQQC